MTQEVNALVPGLVDASPELLSAQLAAGHVHLQVDAVVDRQGRKVGQVFKFFFFIVDRKSLSTSVGSPLTFLLDDLKISGGRHELRESDVEVLHDQPLQVLVAPDEVTQSGLGLGVAQGTARTLVIVGIDAAYIRNVLKVYASIFLLLTFSFA